MTRFKHGTSKRTAARRAGHADRIKRQWADHVPPIAEWRGEDRSEHSLVGDLSEHTDTRGTDLPLDKPSGLLDAKGDSEEGQV